jgi:hypothetical protein
MDTKLVLPFHTLVHHKAQDHVGFFTWIDGRRTDDGTGRSTALDQLDLGLAQDF